MVEHFNLVFQKFPGTSDYILRVLLVLFQLEHYWANRERFTEQGYNRVDSSSAQVVGVFPSLLPNMYRQAALLILHLNPLLPRLLLDGKDFLKRRSQEGFLWNKVKVMIAPDWNARLWDCRGKTTRSYKHRDVGETCDMVQIQILIPVVI